MPLVLLGVKLFEIAEFCLYDVNSVSIKIGITDTFLTILFGSYIFMILALYACNARYL
jgi:hypothetical protein